MTYTASGTNYCSIVCCKCVRMSTLFSPGRDIPLLEGAYNILLLSQIFIWFYTCPIMLLLRPNYFFSNLCFQYYCCHFFKETTTSYFAVRAATFALFYLTGLDFMLPKCTSSPVQDVSLLLAKCIM